MGKPGDVNSDPDSRAAQLLGWARRVALTYALVGSAWIVLSDIAIHGYFGGRADLLLIETVKGLLFIAVTTMLVYWLARGALRGAERRWARERAQSAQQLLESLLASMGEAVLLVDTSNRSIVQCNPAAERVFGYRAEELVGQSTAMIHVDQQAYETFGRESRVVLDRGDVYRTRYRMRRKDGRVIETENIVTTLRDGLNGHPGVVSIIRDITDQVRSQAQLRDSERQYRLLANNTLDVIWSIGLDLGFSYVNPAIERLLGYTPAEVIGQPLANYCPPEVMDDIRQALEQLLARGPGHGGLILATELLHRDGRRIPVEVHGTIVYGGDGTPLGVQGTTRDISERLALEARLQQAQRLESVGQLTGGLAHDFNNLLTVIIGNSELLADGLAEQPGLRVLAEMTGSAAQRGADLTQRLLTFARRQALEPRAVDVNQLLAEMLPLVRRTLGEGIVSDLQPDASLWLALVDPGQLENAVLNLCLNARDAMPGGGQLRITTSNRVLDQATARALVDIQPGQYVVIEVSDNGCGIEPEHIDRIFEPFYTTKERSRGSGLGLPMVYGFVRQSRGHVEIESTPGQGTRVSLYLPRVDTAQATAQKPAAGDEESRQTPGGSETVLLVEDNDLVEQYASEQLATLGYNVIRAGNGPEALATLRSRDDIDLLFTDIVMPGGMSGWQLAEAARQLRPGLAVLYTSGYTEELGEAAEPPDGSPMLRKPYRRAELARKLRAALDRQEQP